MALDYEIDVTDFFNNAGKIDYSASIAEIGYDAASVTWQAANDDSADWPILQTEGQRDAFRAFARSAGFSEADDFAGWTDSQLNALAIQWLAGDIREAGLDGESPDWQAYQADAEAGRVSGNLCRNDDGRVYWLICS